MVSISTTVAVMSCGLLLCIGDVASAADAMKAGQSVAQHDTLVRGADTRKTATVQKKGGQDNPKELIVGQQGVHIIQGDVLRVEGDTYFIKELGGSELSLRADASTITIKAEKIQVGDRVEAKVDENHRALSLLLAP